MLEIQSLFRPPSPQQAFKRRRLRLTCVPLVDLRVAKTTTEDDDEDDAECESRRSATGTIAMDTGKSTFYSKPGICPISESTDSLKTAPASIRIKRLTNVYDGTSRFPKLDECAHFHYELVELGQLQVSLVAWDKQPANGQDNVSLSEDAQENNYRSSINSEHRLLQSIYNIQVTSNTKTWTIRRTYDNFRLFDKQLHKCIYDRKFSVLKELPPCDNLEALSSEMVKKMLSEYLSRFSCIAGNLINCGPVLNWLELDNRGNRLIVTDDSAINTPAVAAAHVIKRYTAQASDELSFEVGDMISVIDMPPPEESIWWRGKKGFEVGFFPCDCVELIGDKLPQSVASNIPTKPVLRKHGKLITFFRSFITSRPSRRKLKQTGILKERVFSCDLGEHLLNSGREVPLVLKCCAETIEKHGIVDGIYRLSGITSNIQKLRCEFDEEKVPDLTEECYLQDIHCVASLLKMYFRELPNPLLTYQLYDKFVSAVQSEEDVRLMRVHDVVQQLPPPHYRTLECLVQHLARVAAYGNKTGMHSKNLAIVWAPNLLRSKELEAGGVAALHGVGVQAIVTEYLIRYADLIFNDKMPSFGPDSLLDATTPKHVRPKSLAISTPTKLLSLEEARMRALTNAPPQKYIEVGGGPASLPSKYHTVIDVPDRKKSRSIKERKSPVSGWKSFFTISKSRSQSSKEKLKQRKNSAQGDISLRDFALTECDISARLRPVKSAESLVSSGNNSSRSSGAMDAIAHLYSGDNTSLVSCQESPNRHQRSISHDSYFEAHAVLAASNMSPIPDSSEETTIIAESSQIPGSHAGTLDSLETAHSPDEDTEVTRLLPETCEQETNLEDRTENDQFLPDNERPRSDHKRKNSWALKEKFMQAFTSPPSSRKSESDASIESHRLSQDNIRQRRSTPRSPTSIKEKLYNAFSPESIRKKMRTPSPRESLKRDSIKGHKSPKGSSRKTSSDSKTSAKTKSFFRKSSEPQIKSRRRSSSLRRSVSNIETTTFMPSAAGDGEMFSKEKSTKIGQPVMYETSFTWSECVKDRSSHRRSLSLDQIYQADSFSSVVEDEAAKNTSSHLVEVEVHATQSPRQTFIEVENGENWQLLHNIDKRVTESTQKPCADLETTQKENFSFDQSKDSSRESPNSGDINMSENEQYSLDSSDNFESEQATTPISLSEQLSELETSRVNTSCSFRESDSIVLSVQTTPDLDNPEEAVNESPTTKETSILKSLLITNNISSNRIEDTYLKGRKSWHGMTCVSRKLETIQQDFKAIDDIDDSEIIYLEDIQISQAEMELSEITKETSHYSHPQKVVQQLSSTSEDSPVHSDKIKSKQIDELSTTTSDDSPVHSSETQSGQSLEDDLSDGELIKKDLAKPDIDRALRTLKDERIMNEMDEPDIEEKTVEPLKESSRDSDDGKVVFKMVMVIPEEPDGDKALETLGEEKLVHGCNSSITLEYDTFSQECCGHRYKEKSDKKKCDEYAQFTNKDDSTVLCKLDDQEVLPESNEKEYLLCTNDMREPLHENNEQADSCERAASYENIERHFSHETVQKTYLNETNDKELSYEDELIKNDERGERKSADEKESADENAEIESADKRGERESSYEKDESASLCERYERESSYENEQVSSFERDDDLESSFEKDEIKSYKKECINDEHKNESSCEISERNDSIPVMNLESVRIEIIECEKNDDKDESDNETVTWTVHLPQRILSEHSREKHNDSITEIRNQITIENCIHSLMEQSTDSERLMSESSDDRLLTDSQTTAMEQSLESDAIGISESSDEKMLTDFSEQMSTPEDFLSRESPLHLEIKNNENDNEVRMDAVGILFSENHEVNANIMTQNGDSMDEAVFYDEDSYPGKEWGVVLRPRLNSQSSSSIDDSFRKKPVSGTFLQTRKASVKELLSRFENQLGQKPPPHDKSVTRRPSFEKHIPPRLKPTSPTSSDCPDTPPTLSPRTSESESNKIFEQCEEEQPFRVMLRRTHSLEPRDQKESEEPPPSPFKVELRKTRTRNLSEQSEAKENVDDQPVFKVELRKTNRDLTEQATKETSFPPTKLEKYESSPVFSPRTSLVRMSRQSGKFSLSSPGLLPDQSSEHGLGSFIGIKYQKERTRNSNSEASLFTKKRSWHDGEKGKSADIFPETKNSELFQKPSYLSKKDYTVTRRTGLTVSSDWQRPRSSPPVFHTYSSSPVFSPRKLGSPCEADGTAIEATIARPSSRSSSGRGSPWLGKVKSISDDDSDWSDCTRQHGGLSGDIHSEESSSNIKNIPQYLSSV